MQWTPEKLAQKVKMLQNVRNGTDPVRALAHPLLRIIVNHSYDCMRWGGD